MNLRSIVLAASLALLLASGRQRAQGAEPATVNLIDLPSDTGGEIYYAQDLGYFKAAGLDVHVTSMTSSPAIVSALVSGAADIGFSVVGSAALARERGIAVRFIAPGALWLTSAGTAQLVTAKDSPLRTAPDFNGKTIAVTGLADLTYYGTRAWLEKNGATIGSVKFVELPFPEMAAAVAQHRGDAAMIAEPFLTAAKPDTKIVAPVDDAIAPRFMSTGWIVSEAWLRTHADVATRFAAVMRQTAQWANAHHKESAEILMRYTKISPEVAATMGRVEYALTLDPKLLQPPLDIAAKYAPNTPPTVTAADLTWTPGNSRAGRSVGRRVEHTSAEGRAMNARFVSFLAAAVAIAGFAATSAPAAAITWIHKTVGSFSCYIPASTWQVVGNKNGVDISSPTGDEDVSFGQTAWPAVVTTQAVATQMLTLSARSGSLTNGSITGRGAASQTAAGITMQRFNFQGVHHWVNGTEPVVGYMIVTVFNHLGARGYSVSLVEAPTAKANADSAMLEFIRGHITYYGANP
jgi:NitT/TauT family transport system substrate-binding protein